MRQKVTLDQAKKLCSKIIRKSRGEDGNVSINEVEMEYLFNDVTFKEASAIGKELNIIRAGRKKRSPKKITTSLIFYNFLQEVKENPAEIKIAINTVRDFTAYIEDPDFFINVSKSLIKVNEILTPTIFTENSHPKNSTVTLHIHNVFLNCKNQVVAKEVNGGYLITNLPEFETFFHGKVSELNQIQNINGYNSTAKFQYTYTGQNSVSAIFHYQINSPDNDYRLLSSVYGDHSDSIVNTIGKFTIMDIEFNSRIIYFDDKLTKLI